MITEQHGRSPIAHPRRALILVPRITAALLVTVTATACAAGAPSTATSRRPMISCGKDNNTSVAATTSLSIRPP